MTIDSAYIPEIYLNNGTPNYTFTAELANEDSEVVVYIIDSEGVYALLPDAFYTVTFNPYRSPMSDGATLTFAGALSPVVSAISINRVTEITDTQVFPDGEPFKAESFEFQSDKLTLILQEINAVGCDCRGKVSAPVGNIVFTGGQGPASNIVSDIIVFAPETTGDTPSADGVFSALVGDDTVTVAAFNSATPTGSVVFTNGGYTFTIDTVTDVVTTSITCGGGGTCTDTKDFNITGVVTGPEYPSGQAFTGTYAAIGNCQEGAPGACEPGVSAYTYTCSISVT